MQQQPYIGKVRKVTDLGYGKLLLSASDRLSAFDRHICNVDGKGISLNKSSEWWFKNTSQIIENHYLYTKGEHMIVTKTEPIKLEFIVRGYMTGSTSTSIWPMYKDGKREMYGIKFRDGYQKNQKLDQIILTPTTKGERDTPITEQEIVDENYLDIEDLEYIKKSCFDLFEFGQMVAESKGLILVDTKYEFGKIDDKIILIDELHTCDSSRYWKAETYDYRFKTGQEPEKFDKDCVRDFVRSKCDPYKDDLPEIPEELIKRVERVYHDFYKLFHKEDLVPVGVIDEKEMIQDYMKIWSRELVVILAGSTSDREWCEKN